MKKFRLIFMTVFLMVILTGCRDTKVYFEYQFYQNGTGTMKGYAVLTNEGLRNIIGGEEALDNVISKYNPGFINVKKEKINDTIVYQFNTVFNDFNDFIQKYKVINGEDAFREDGPLTYEEIEHIFQPQINFNGNITNDKTIYLVADILIKEKLVNYKSPVQFIPSSKVRTLMPDEMKTENGFSYTKQYTLNNVVVNTNVHNNEKIERIISIELFKNMEQEIGRTKLKKYFTNILDKDGSLDVVDNEGIVTYTIKFEGTPKEVSELTNKIGLNKNNVITLKLDNKEKHTEYHYSDNFDLSGLINPMYIIDGINYNTYLMGQDKIIEFNNELVNKDTLKEDTNVLNKNFNQISKTIYGESTYNIDYIARVNKENNMVAVIITILAIILVVIGGLVGYKFYIKTK